MPDIQLTAEELRTHLERDFPEAFNGQSGLHIEAVWEGGARLRQDFRPEFLRPGGTISGPTLMALADTALYAALLGTIGWQPLAVTSTLTFNFLRKPPQGSLVADARFLKIGRRIATGQVSIMAEGNCELLAHATGSYAIPSTVK